MLGRVHGTFGEVRRWVFSCTKRRNQHKHGEHVGPLVFSRQWKSIHEHGHVNYEHEMSRLSMSTLGIKPGLDDEHEPMSNIIGSLNVKFLLRYVLADSSTMIHLEIFAHRMSSSRVCTATLNTYYCHALCNPGSL